MYLKIINKYRVNGRSLGTNWFVKDRSSNWTPYDRDLFILVGGVPEDLNSF